MNKTENMTLRLLKQDMKYQTQRKWYYFLLVIPLILLKFRELAKINVPEGTTDGYGFGDYLAYLFQGPLEYIKDIHPFELNPDFMLLHIIPAYMIAYYPIRDLQSRGKQIFIRIGRIQYWWYAKCLWTFLNISIYYLVIWITAAVCAGNLKIDTNTIVYLILLPYLTSIMLSGLQITIALITAPVYGFMCTVFQLLAATYSFSKYLPGNYLMVNRMILAREGGVTFGMSALLCILVILLSFAVGCMYIRKKDIL
jgi:hypothetical protein